MSQDETSATELDELISAAIDGRKVQPQLLLAGEATFVQHVVALSQLIQPPATQRVMRRATQRAVQRLAVEIDTIDTIEGATSTDTEFILDNAVDGQGTNAQGGQLNFGPGLINVEAEAEAAAYALAEVDDD